MNARSYHRKQSHRYIDIPEKANRIMKMILIAMILIILRIWHLAVVQYDEKFEEAKKPQRRIVMEAAKRGTIRDRFNIPLAINKIQYQAAILYSQLRQIPSIKWEKSSDGKRVKRFKRKEYITQLAQLLGKELQLDSERLEDLIHSKAAYYSQIPYVIKEDISEKEYYRLKMLEKDWLGIQVQHLPKRHYPKEKVAADIIGYMGAINRQEYENIIQEIKTLEEYIEKREAGEDLELPEGVESPSSVRKRLHDLQEHAYSINDYVGKTGIEGYFEEDLRGYQGKKSYSSDARGNFLRELPGSRAPLSGNRLLLTISSELQEYAEKLLTQNERIREARVSKIDPSKPSPPSMKQPWIKGGAIVAIDPNTGEVLALASHPRFDPNDFIISGNSEINKRKRSNILRWFESEAYIGEIWDQKRPLEKELFDDSKNKFYEESKILTWEQYLSFILPKQSSVKEGISSIYNIKNAVEVQQNVETLLRLSEQNNAYWLFNVLYTNPEHQAHGSKMQTHIKASIENNLKKHAEEVSKIRKKIDFYFEKISSNYDKILLVDLCRVAVNGSLFSEDLLLNIGGQSLSQYRTNSAAYVAILEPVQKMAKDLYHDLYFKQWRKDYEKEFLKQKREEEKATKRYPKPYIDYLDAKENEMFLEFWNENRWQFLTAFLMGDIVRGSKSELEPFLEHFITWHSELSEGAHGALPWKKAYDVLTESLKSFQTELAQEYLKTLRGFQDLNRPLLGRYRYSRKTSFGQIEKNLAAAFYPKNGFGYGRSQAYRQAATQGSIFKLVTAYEALVQRYQQLDTSSINSASLNPLIIFDHIFRHGKDLFVGYHADGKAIPQFYKGGRLLKSHASNIGRIDLLSALETSSNPYFSILAGDVLKSPLDLAKAAKAFSYGHFTGIELPAEIPGKVPEDLDINRTGLYAMANGQHTLVVTPLQTSIMLSALANGGKVLKPKIVLMTAGSEPMRDKNYIDVPHHFNYQDSLKLAGIDFPLFSAILNLGQKSLVNHIPTQVKNQIFMPDIIKNMLLTGMHRVVLKQLKEGLSSLSKFYSDYPEAISDYLELKEQMVGKTSTAEAVENLDLDLQQGTNTYTHVWFGGIAFDSDIFNEKETFLYRDRFGNPELVVVVYLRFGIWGKEAAPIGAQIVKKWREIKEKMGRGL